MNLHFCDEPWDARYTCDVSTTSPTELAAATLSATQLLDAMSGHQFGLCTVTFRPCRLSCSTAYDGWSIVGVLPRWAAFSNLYWPLAECGVCVVGCTCGVLSQVALPSPVHDVVTVKLDGAVAPTGTYRVDDNKWLVRLDGTSWPACNDLSKADTEVGTWSVTARFGQDPPELARGAVGQMACEILKSFRGDDCGLPQNVVSLARQGVTIKYADVSSAFEEGRTGLYLVDAFIEAVNPGRLRRRSRVFNVDRAPQRRAGT